MESISQKVVSCLLLWGRRISLRPFSNKYLGINRLAARIAWAVDDLAELLDRADIVAIQKDFGRRTRRQDPVVHFYETFLAAYHPKMRKARGVYYTPEPVVSYIVRSIDHGFTVTVRCWYIMDIA